MKVACKYVEVLLAFCRLPAALSRGFNSSFTSARMYPDRCKPLVPAVVGQVTLGVPFIKRPLCYHRNIMKVTFTFLLTFTYLILLTSSYLLSLTYSHLLTSSYLLSLTYLLTFTYLLSVTYSHLLTVVVYPLP